MNLLLPGKIVGFYEYVLPSMNTRGVGWQEWSFSVEQEHPPVWWVGSQFRLRFQLTSPHRLRPHPPLGQDWTRWTRHYHQWQYYLLHLGEGPKWHRGRRNPSVCNTRIKTPTVKQMRSASTNVRFDYSVKNCQHENWRPQNLQDTRLSWFEKYQKLNCNYHKFKLLRMWKGDYTVPRARWRAHTVTKNQHRLLNIWHILVLSITMVLTESLSWALLSVSCLLCNMSNISL